MPKVEIIQRGDAGEHMKVVARRLFAQRGIDGVTVREIAEAAGQKNHAAVGYYYGSKEALVREIIRDGASMIEERRARWLAKLEADGGPHSVRDVVDVLVYPSIGLDGEGREESYARFFLMMAQNHRALYLDTLAGRWNTSYQRCLDHLRRLMPDMDPALKNQRFVFLGGYLGSVLAIRETGLTHAAHGHHTWGSEMALLHFAETVTALLNAPPPSKEDLEAHPTTGWEDDIVGTLGVMPG